MHPAAPGLQRDLLRHELRPLVVADHVGQRNRRVLIRRMPVAGESHGRNAGGVDHASHAILPRRFQNRPRAVDVGPVHLRRIAHPEPVVGRHVKHGIASRHGFFEGSSIAQIPGCGLRLETLQIVQIASWTDQQPQVRALIGKNAGNMGAQKSGGACDESFQKQFSVLSLKEGLADQWINESERRVSNRPHPRVRVTCGSKCDGLIVATLA